MEEKAYIVDKSDEELFLVPPTGGNYKKVKLILLKCANVPIQKKKEICKEFKLDESKEISDKYDIQKQYEELASALFITDKKFKFDDLYLNAVNEAYKNFFTSIG